MKIIGGGGGRGGGGGGQKVAVLYGARSPMAAQCQLGRPSLLIISVLEFGRKMGYFSR